MHIDVTGQQLEVTTALRDYATSKLVKLERHYDHVTQTHVVLSVEKQRQRAEATIHLAGGKLFADAVDHSMYAAIDALVDKLDGQIRKHKGKRCDRFHGNIERRHAPR
ncbi:MAG: ribosome-associated translation inhibitor RaiA [Pseudomonadota bacterium]